MPHCRNCGNVARFVLFLELSVHVRVVDVPDYADPDWALGLQCAACASHDVTI